MSNPYEDWDEYDWQNHIRKVSHEEFLTTDKGKQWKKDKQIEKINDNLKHLLLFVIGIAILLLIIWGGGCDMNSGNDPYRK